MIVNDLWQSVQQLVWKRGRTGLRRRIAEKREALSMREEEGGGEQHQGREARRRDGRVELLEYNVLDGLTL
jgi:hypothetical protein